MNLSAHFTLEEACHSQMAIAHGIANIPNHDVMSVLSRTAVHMETLRALLSHPITISSWYRSPEVNTLVGSANTSQHIKGEAVDFISPSFGDPLHICRAIIANKDTIPFDQLILEHGWVHISFAILSGQPRGQVLSLLSNGHYAQGLTNAHGVPY